MPSSDNVAVHALRGGRVESRHRAHVAVADADGNLLASFGDAGHATYLRSAWKPFQVAPLVSTGAADALGITDEELAVAAGSHSGEEAHVRAALSILEKAGVSPGALACGAHRPYHKPTAEALGDKFEAIHNNCSGKHAAMLALATHLDAPLEGYLAPDHPVQREVLAVVAAATGLPRDEVGVAVDGCGAPTFRVPLRAGATALARLGRPAGVDAEVAAALSRVAGAMARHPWHVAGTDRFDTDLMDSSEGLVAKAGAEAVQAVANLPAGQALLLKVEDGGRRATAPATVEALRQLGWLDVRAFETLGDHWRPPLKNHAGATVGRLEPVLELDLAAAPGHA